MIGTLGFTPEQAYQFDQDEVALAMQGHNDSKRTWRDLAWMLLIAFIRVKIGKWDTAHRQDWISIPGDPPKAKTDRTFINPA